MANVILDAVRKAQKRDKDYADLKDVRALWGDTPKKLSDAHKEVQKVALPSQVREGEEIRYKGAFSLRTRGVHEDWRS